MGMCSRGNPGSMESVFTPTSRRSCFLRIRSARTTLADGLVAALYSAASTDRLGPRSHEAAQPRLLCMGDREWAEPGRGSPRRTRQSRGRWHADGPAEAAARAGRRGAVPVAMSKRQPSMPLPNDPVARRHEVPAPAIDSLAGDFLTAHRRGLGATVWLVDGIPWTRSGASTAMAFPAESVHPITRSHLRSVFQATGMALAQFVTSADTGWPCVRYALRDKAYSEQSLQRQFRQRLQRGDARLTFRRLSWSELGEKGADVLASKATQARKKAVFVPGAWLEACNRGARDSRFIVFGCLDASRLVGFAIFLRHSGWYQAIDITCHPASFAHGSANVLLYHSARALIQQPDCHTVCFGRTGIPNLEGTRFMRHAGLDEELLRIAAVLSPRWSWLGRGGIPAALRTLLGHSHRLPRGLKNHLYGLALACETDVGKLRP